MSLFHFVHFVSTHCIGHQGHAPGKHDHVPGLGSRLPQHGQSMHQVLSIIMRVQRVSKSLCKKHTHLCRGTWAKQAKGRTEAGDVPITSVCAIFQVPKSGRAAFKLPPAIVKKLDFYAFCLFD
jgi:hypothetical protein